MSAEVLREAARRMRDCAEPATQGPWRALLVGERADVRGLPENTTYDHRGDSVATAADSEFGACKPQDAAHIASWHPAVALAVADWLDEAADLWAETYTDYQTRALAVASAYLGTDA